MATKHSKVARESRMNNNNTNKSKSYDIGNLEHSPQPLNIPSNNPSNSGFSSLQSRNSQNTNNRQRSFRNVWGAKGRNQDMGNTLPNDMQTASTISSNRPISLPSGNTSTAATTASISNKNLNMNRSNIATNANTNNPWNNRQHNNNNKNNTQSNRPPPSSSSQPLSQPLLRPNKNNDNNNNNNNRQQQHFMRSSTQQNISTKNIAKNDHPADKPKQFAQHRSWADLENAESDEEATEQITNNDNNNNNNDGKQFEKTPNNNDNDNDTEKRTMENENGEEDDQQQQNKEDYYNEQPMINDEYSNEVNTTNNQTTDNNNTYYESLYDNDNNNDNNINNEDYYPSSQYYDYNANDKFSKRRFGQNQNANNMNTQYGNRRLKYYNTNDEQYGGNNDTNKQNYYDDNNNNDINNNDDHTIDNQKYDTEEYNTNKQNFSRQKQIYDIPPDSFDRQQNRRTPKSSRGYYNKSGYGMRSRRTGQYTIRVNDDSWENYLRFAAAAQITEEPALVSSRRESYRKYLEEITERKEREIAQLREFRDARRNNAKRFAQEWIEYLKGNVSKKDESMRAEGATTISSQQKPSQQLLSTQSKTQPTQIKSPMSSQATTSTPRVLQQTQTLTSVQQATDSTQATPRSRPLTPSKKPLTPSIQSSQTFNIPKQQQPQQSLLSSYTTPYSITSLTPAAGTTTTATMPTTQTPTHDRAPREPLTHVPKIVKQNISAPSQQPSITTSMLPNFNLIQSQSDLLALQQPQVYTQHQQPPMNQQLTWDSSLHGLQPSYGSRGASPSQTNPYMYLPQYPLTVDQTTQPSTPYNGTTIQNSAVTPQLPTANAMPSIHLLDLNPQNQPQIHSLHMPQTTQTHSQDISQYYSQLPQSSFIQAQMMQQQPTKQQPLQQSIVQQSHPNTYQPQYDQQSYSQFNTMQTIPMQQQAQQQLQQPQQQPQQPQQQQQQQAPQQLQNQIPNQNYSFNYPYQTIPATTTQQQQQSNTHPYHSQYLQMSNQPQQQSMNQQSNVTPHSQQQYYQKWQ